MTENPRRSRGFVWPGFGLAIGAGLGAIVGLIWSPSLFVVGMTVGASLGLVVGAIIEQSRPH